MAQRFAVPAQKPQEHVQANAAQASLPPKLNEKAEMEQLNAMYSLLENRYSNAVSLRSRCKRSGPEDSRFERQERIDPRRGGVEVGEWMRVADISLSIVSYVK